MRPSSSAGISGRIPDITRDMKIYGLMLLTFTLLIPSLSIAEDPVPRRSLSQLDFDIPTSKPAIDAKADPDSLDGEEEEVNSAKVIDKSILPGGISDSEPEVPVVPREEKKAADSDKVVKPARQIEPGTELTFLAPRLKGPETDKNNSSVITSTLSWKKNKKGACQAPEGNAELCQKANSLKEVLRRFSGSDEFYDSQCQIACNNQDESSRLVALDLKGAAKDAFTFNRDKGLCRYQIAKKKEDKWVVLNSAKTVCSCLPLSCDM